MKKLVLLKLILNLQKTKRENLPKYEEKEDLWDQKSYSNKMIKKKKKISYQMLRVLVLKSEPVVVPVCSLVWVGRLED